MISLLQIFHRLKELRNKFDELNTKKIQLEKYIPNERNRLLQQKNHKEGTLRAEITNAKTSAISGLLWVKAHTTLARFIANEQAPRLLRQEWENQQHAIAKLMLQADSSPSDDSPARLLSLPWSHPYWNPCVDNHSSYKPRTKGLAPGILRIGELSIERELDGAKVPAIVPIRHFNNSANRMPGHIAIFSNDNKSRKSAISAIESMALRVISTFPLRKIRGVFIDPISMGNSFPFKSLPRFVVNQQTYTRAEDIREQLQKLTVHTQQVIQNYLSRYYETIEEYNAEKSSIEEAYRYLFVADFPSNFDNAACEDLKSLLVNGSKAGVYVVIHIDDTLEKPRNFSYDIFHDYCTVLRPTHGLTIGGSFNTGGSLKAGYIYVGRVTRIIHTGAYVEFLPNKEGFIHTAQLAEHRVSSPREVVSEGQIITVKVLDIDSKERVNLTCVGIKKYEYSAAARKAFRSEELGTEYNPLFTLELPNGIAFNVNLDQPPPSKQFNQITDSITKAAKNIKADTVSFPELYPDNFWSCDSRKEIRAPIGITGARDKVEFWMGNNEDGLVVSSGLLAGKPGAGKSFTLHAIITSLAMKYSPDELEMYLLDFKEGVEFQIYVDPEKSEKTNLSEDLTEDNALPHAKVISIESDREFGLSVLQKVKQEIEERGSKFKSVGVSSLKEYRDKTNSIMPRILVVIDEFQYMFQETDNITQQLNLIFEDITRRGRAFGVHLLIASQSPNVPNMNRRIYSFIELRMAMQMDQNTSAFVLAEGNTSAVDLLDRPGKIIYNKDFGRKGHNDIGQIADVSLIERQNSLRCIQSIAQQKEYQRPESLILFNGTRPSKLSNNNQLKKLSKINTWLSASELNKQIVQEPDWLVQEFPGVAWLGEAMRIGNHTQAVFRRRPRSNMLMIGASEEIIYGILSGILLSLVHCYEPQKAEFQIIDLSQTAEGGENFWANMTTDFQNNFKNYFPITIGKRFPDNEQQILRGEKVLQNVFTELERRKQYRDANPDDLNVGASVFFVCGISRLNRIQNLRPVIGRLNKQEMSPDAQKLHTLVSQGPELGIHTILWLDSTKTFLQLFGDTRSAFNHFDLRVGLTMPAEDSRMLFVESYAQNLSRLRAYFYDVAFANKLEKFKPYAVVSAEEMSEYSQIFKQRNF